MKIVVYLCSLVAAILGIALAFEFGLNQFLPEAYRGYLIEDDGGNVKWAIGPYEPSEAALGFNSPIPIKKPKDTIRIVALGASGAEGWLTAITVFNKYGQEWEPKTLSSYPRAIEFSINKIADSSAKRVEVINLGIAAYNITDVIRMLKDSLKLDPDLLVIQIGGNETWTAERSRLSALIDDVPYFYAELGHEIYTAIQAGWKTLSAGGNAFNPLVLFSSGSQPIVIEPPGRTEGLEQRLENYRSELERLGKFLERKQIPTLFLLPQQNIAGYRPFGSMAKPGTSDQQLTTLNELLIAALAEPLPGSKDKYLEILKLDDGIAEANFQLGTLALLENDIERAREYFWLANDRDLVLKRLPSDFHKISHEFLEQNAFPYIDVMRLFDTRSASGLVSFDWLDDDVHLNRKGQFELANEIVETIIRENLLQAAGYTGDVQQLPTFADYNAWTGFDDEAAGTIAYVKGVHNFITFGRYPLRISWDPRPALFIEPIIDDLDIANSLAPSDESRSLSVVLNLFLGRPENAQADIAALDCRVSVERGRQIYWLLMSVVRSVFVFPAQKYKDELQTMLAQEGCAQ